MLGMGVPPTLARVTTFDCPDARNAGSTNYRNRAPPRASVASPRRTLTSDCPGRRAGGQRGGGWPSVGGTRAANDGERKTASAGSRA